MKYLFKFLMMFIAYNGFAQGGQRGNTKSVITFPNGDENITIIENSDSNVIQLTTTDDVNKYEMLDLSNHESVHRSIKKRDIIRTETGKKSNQLYMVARPETDHPDEPEDVDHTSGA